MWGSPASFSIARLWFSMQPIYFRKAIFVFVYRGAILHFSAWRISGKQKVRLWGKCSSEILTFSPLQLKLEIMILKAVANFELHFDNNKFSDVLKIFAIRILVPFTTLLTTSADVLIFKYWQGRSLCFTFLIEF